MEYLHVQYRAVEGEVIERLIADRQITISDIDCLCMQYFEKTGREPEAVFVDIGYYWELQQTIANPRCYSLPASEPANMRLMLSMGPISVLPVKNSYTPILVGTQTEFDDNDINKVFEETVMKDFDHA